MDPGDHNGVAPGGVGNAQSVKASSLCHDFVADDGWRKLTLLCQKYTRSRAYPKSKALAALPTSTIVGPVIEVQVVKILDKYGLEVAIPSICKVRDTSHVVIYGETEQSRSQDQ